MNIPAFPNQIVDWLSIPREPHPGNSGMAYWQTCRAAEMRVRMVEYSPGYESDHWCEKGHIIYCVHGSLQVKLANNRELRVEQGMCCFLPEKKEAHLTSSPGGCRLLIID